LFKGQLIGDLVTQFQGDNEVELLLLGDEGLHPYANVEHFAE
jgi:hypothetical protein